VPHSSPVFGLEWVNGNLPLFSALIEGKIHPAANHIHQLILQIEILVRPPAFGVYSRLGREQLVDRTPQSVHMFSRIDFPEPLPDIRLVRLDEAEVPIVIFLIMSAADPH
jgi:hypothetical protein